MGYLALLTITSVTAADTPTALDLSPYFWEHFASDEGTNRCFATVLGPRTFDGVPFQVDGRACLFGRLQGNYCDNTPSDYPDFLDIPVGRAFEELHLLHAAQWWDKEGVTIAHIRLNYADGTKHEFPIGYGVHVRDWQRYGWEKEELLSDPDTRVIWRGPGGRPESGSEQRMFKSLLRNPWPEKVVTTMDLVSTGQRASYDICAATVTDRDPSRLATDTSGLDTPPPPWTGWAGLGCGAVRTSEVKDMPRPASLAAGSNKKVEVDIQGFARLTTGSISGPLPVLFIDFPIGTTVRIEATSDLTMPWTTLTTISSLPSTPYPFVYNPDVTGSPLQFFRAVPVP